MKNMKEYAGEAIGTFILVLFGCGAVAVAVLFNSFGSLLEVALIWGFGVTLAIFSVRNVCPAHLNPAVSVAMLLAKKLPLKKLPAYVTSQFLGALAAAFLLYFLFGDGITEFEMNNSIIRGTADSAQTSMIFGEFFPNPGFADQLSVSPLFACLVEMLGTFLLIFVIFRLTEKETQQDSLTPVLIGLTVTIIICLVAPFTQAGLNPARDFAPRLVAYFMGWGDAAFPVGNYSFLTVYIVSPIVGGVIATYLHQFLSSNEA